MKTLCAAAIFMLIAAPFMKADWTVLKNDAGEIVEVAVDFTIKKKTINPDGSVSLVLSATNAGEEIGFSALISKPSESTVVGKKKESVRVVHRNVTLTSIGEPTKTLEKRLALQLKAQSRRIVGLYNTTSYWPHGFSLTFPDVFTTFDLQLTFDDEGKIVGGDCFDIRFIPDIPMNRFTAYFSKREAIIEFMEGIPEAARVRGNKMTAGKTGKVSP